MNCELHVSTDLLDGVVTKKVSEDVIRPFQIISWSSSKHRTLD